MDDLPITLCIADKEFFSVDRDSFPTTNEYFRFGLEGKQGYLLQNVSRCCQQHQNKGNTFLGALSLTSPLLIWQKNRSIYSYGAGLKGSEWTVFGNTMKGLFRCSLK